jgi:hypothetical protein
VGNVGKVGWLDAVTTPGNKLEPVVGTTEDVGADGEVAEVASVVEVVAPEMEVVVVAGVVSKGKAIGPAISKVVVTGTLVVVATEGVLAGVVFLFFLADGLATGLRTTRTWVDALAEIATLISMGTRTLP